MAPEQANSLVRHLRRVVRGQQEEDLTDRELLRRFVAHRDEEAFATIVRRYGPLVLGVCQRVLHHRQDAEDAFQATFLVLLHKAGSLAHPELVGNWLYGVAYYTAKNARTSTARRRARERQVIEMPKAPSAAADNDWRELQPLLDEELSRLPEKYRVPLVLCELHGKSRKEVALHLGCPEGTVSSRLARARELLRARLTKRGLTLSAGALAAVLSRDLAAAAVPAPLVASTVQTVMLVAAAPVPAAGVVSAHVAALAERVLKSMFLAKLKALTIVLVVVSVLTGAGVLAHQALADKPEPPKAAVPPERPKAAHVTQEKPGPVPEDAKEVILVTGEVLDPDGKPIAGASLYSPRWYKDRSTGREEATVVERGTTGKDGRFRLSLPRPVARPGRSVVLIAAAGGFGLDWVEPRPDAPGDLTLRLVKDVPIRGRLLSTEGKPVADATVLVEDVTAVGKLDEFLTALQRSWRAAETLPTKRLTLPLTRVLRVTTSDRDGRFVVTGAGAERLVGLKVQGGRVAQSGFLVITHEGVDVAAINRTFAKQGPGMAVVCGPVFEHVVEPSRPVEGTVRETGTGKPVAGATVYATANTGAAPVVTDAQGRYRLLGLRKAAQYTVHVTPPRDAPLIGRQTRVADVPGSLEPLKADVELPRGVVVTGRVFDKATGQGVESSLGYAPLPDNPLADKVANLSLYGTTDADGRFRLVTIPGSGVLLAQVHGTRETVNGVRVNPYPVDRYKKAELDAADRKRVVGVGIELSNAYKVLDLKEGGEAVACDLAVDPGQTLTVNLTDPDGKPLAGAIIAGSSPMAIGAISLKSDSCPVYALDPRKPRTLILLHPQRKLAALVTVRGDEKGPLTVRLGPTAVVTGRLLDADGQGVAGADVAALYAGPGGRELVKELVRRGELARTDADGRFRLDSVVPGLSFELGMAKGRQQLVAEPRPKVKPLEPGKTLDLGDLRTKPEK